MKCRTISVVNLQGPSRLGFTDEGKLYLERFDSDGITRRVGDARVLRRR